MSTIDDIRCLKVKALHFRLHPLPSAAGLAALPRGHVAIALVGVGVGFADRAAVVVGFSQDLWQFTYQHLYNP